MTRPPAHEASPAGMQADPENERLMRRPWLNQVRLARYWMRRGLVGDPAAAAASFMDVFGGADVVVTHPTFGCGSVPVARHLGIPVAWDSNEANLQHLADEPGAFDFSPIQRVVHRCAAAVVSGALGTLAAALTAGVPVVVLPQLFDQLWHGRRVEALRVGIMATRPDQVAGAVKALLNDRGYRQRASELGEKLRTEDGAAALVDAVTDLI